MNNYIFFGPMVLSGIPSIFFPGRKLSLLFSPLFDEIFPPESYYYVSFPPSLFKPYNLPLGFRFQVSSQWNKVDAENRPRLPLSTAPSSPRSNPILANAFLFPLNLNPIQSIEIMPPYLSQYSMTSISVEIPLNLCSADSFLCVCVCVF